MGFQQLKYMYFLSVIDFLSSNNAEWIELDKNYVKSSKELDSMHMLKKQFLHMRYHATRSQIKGPVKNNAVAITLCQHCM